MKEQWNERYSSEEYVYGTAPNAWFKAFIDGRSPGTLLLPADGEGRNSVYAAEKGWQVDAFDFSEAARSKALKLADSRGVSIHYFVNDIATFRTAKLYNAIGLIFVHLPPALRHEVHSYLATCLKPGGRIVLQAYTRQQLKYMTGGPKSEELLFDPKELLSDFAALKIIELRNIVTEVHEGSLHAGKAAVVSLIAEKTD